MQGDGEKITPANCQESEAVQKSSVSSRNWNLFRVWLRSLLLFFLSSLELPTASIPRNGSLLLPPQLEDSLFLSLLIPFC